MNILHPGGYTCLEHEAFHGRLEDRGSFLERAKQVANHVARQMPHVGRLSCGCHL